MTSETAKFILLFTLIIAIAQGLTIIIAQIYIVPTFKALFRHL